MRTIIRVQDNGQVTIPNHIRNKAGLTKGDLMEASFERGRIVLTPKADADRDQHSAAQRRAIDKDIAASEQEYASGRSFGPFASHKEFVASLHAESRKLGARKSKRPRR
jgi:AbrB family looped-hinge helix DNA binding protein